MSLDFNMIVMLWNEFIRLCIKKQPELLPAAKYPKIKPKTYNVNPINNT